jgi:molybdenum cofactor biosynthesis enzyme MoaA
MLLYGFACRSTASRNRILFSVGISPLGVPIHSGGANAQRSQRAARDEMKGRKTHAQTIHAMDAATGGSCADCNVLRVVACGDQSSCWTRNDTISYHNATRPWFRLFLAPLIKEHV